MPRITLYNLALFCKAFPTLPNLANLPQEPKIGTAPAASNNKLTPKLVIASPLLTDGSVKSAKAWAPVPASPDTAPTAVPTGPKNDDTVEAISAVIPPS